MSHEDRVLRLVHPLIRAGRLVRRLVDRREHGRWLTRWLSRSAIHQDVTETWPDRYPRLFAAAQALLGPVEAHAILSFGCANGAEVVSLRRYFPNAMITGAELNRVELAACRRLPADPRAAFIRSTRAGIAAHGPYDAIFCMAVLQRRPHAVEQAGRTDISSHYPFARFDDEIGFLAAQLRPGGLLIVEHSQYRVEDSTAIAGLAPVAGAGDWPAKGPRFDRTGRLLPPPVGIARLFRRTGNHETIVA